jgi:hypothetical protein
VITAPAGAVRSSRSSIEVLGRTGDDRRVGDRHAVADRRAEQDRVVLDGEVVTDQERPVEHDVVVRVEPRSDGDGGPAQGGEGHTILDLGARSDGDRRRLVRPDGGPAPRSTNVPFPMTELEMQARKPMNAKFPMRELTTSAWWARLVRVPVEVDRGPQRRVPLTAT